MRVLVSVIRLLRILFLIGVLCAWAGLHGQGRLKAQPAEESSYGSAFFAQLRSVFGQFLAADLDRTFQTAEPIACSELVVDRGEWKIVAFFNEDRSLGAWCRNSIKEVKADLSTYTFRGDCRQGQATIQVATQFPVSSSIDAYNEGKIGLNQIHVNANLPVSAAFDPRTEIYSFELPYLFLVYRRSSGNAYSLIAPNLEDRYDAQVTSRWECKSVRSADVTYRFLICRTETVARSLALRNQSRDRYFGASAYYVLSDGREARTSVRLSFGDLPVTAPPDAAAAGAWQVPAAGSKVLDAAKNGFRLRFSPQTWSDKIGSPEILSDQKILRPQSGPPQQGTHCLWSPAATNLLSRLLAQEPDAEVSYSVKAIDKSSQSDAGIVFDMKTHAGTALGTLQCFFAGAESAAAVSFERWVSVVGEHLRLQVRP